MSTNSVMFNPVNRSYCLSHAQLKHNYYVFPNILAVRFKAYPLLKALVIINKDHS